MPRFAPLLSAALGVLALTACATTDYGSAPPPSTTPNNDALLGGPDPYAEDAAYVDGAYSAPAGTYSDPAYASPPPAQSESTYNQDEVIAAAEDWLGVSAETVGSVVERIFAEQGEPVGYIYGGEGAGAIGAGLRYGDGTLVMRDGRTQRVFWQGPSIGWDFGGNASKTFTLVYNLRDPEMIFRRFPGVEGSAYFIGGIGVNYQRADGITLAPMRAGVGARLGANIGYLAYSRQRNILPF